MKHLFTEVVLPASLNRQDFDDTMALFRRVNKDLTGKYSELDDELKTWIMKWYPVLVSTSDPHPSKDGIPCCTYYIALPVDDAIVFSPPDDNREATIMAWEHGHPLLLVAVSVLINLCQCDQFAEVWAIIRDLRGNSWARRPVGMSRPTAIIVRDNFYTTLGRLIRGEGAGKDEG